MTRTIMLAALAATPLFVLALGQNAGAQPRARVSYNDLDLSQAADIRILDRRIRSAIQEACGPARDSDLAGRNEVRRCRAETKARVADQRDMAIAVARQAKRTALADPD